MRDRSYAPYATASGSVAYAGGVGGNAANIYWGDIVTVTFPANRFTQPPIVTASVDPKETGGVGAGVDVRSTTTTSVGLRMKRIAAAVPSGFTANWIAMQMTAEGGAG